jgi:small-conductance mechanosensitive channel
MARWRCWFSGHDEATPQHGGTLVPIWRGTRAELEDYALVLRWLLVMSFVALAFAAFWYFGLLHRMLATDVTHISTLILTVFVLTSLHCLYHTMEVSKELMVSRRAREGIRRTVHPKSVS